MTKQEFLAMSLPYSLKCVFDYGPNDQSVEPLTGITCNCEQLQGFDYDGDVDGCLPILHPPSDLTKPIEHNGAKFVPIDQLRGGHGSIDFIYSFVYNNSLSIYQIDFWIVQKLIEWHFDIAGLIEKGEAIDVNTLLENPYK